MQMKAKSCHLMLMWAQTDTDTYADEGEDASCDRGYCGKAYLKRKLSSSGDTCTCLRQGGQEFSEGTSMHVYVPSQGDILVFKLFSRRTTFRILVS